MKRFPTLGIFELVNMYLKFHISHNNPSNHPTKSSTKTRYFACFRYFKVLTKLATLPHVEFGCYKPHVPIHAILLHTIKNTNIFQYLK